MIAFTRAMNRSMQQQLPPSLMAPRNVTNMIAFTRAMNRSMQQQLPPSLMAPPDGIPTDHVMMNYFQRKTARYDCIYTRAMFWLGIYFLIVEISAQME